MTIFVVFKFF